MGAKKRIQRMGMDDAHLLATYALRYCSELAGMGGDHTDEDAERFEAAAKAIDRHLARRGVIDKTPPSAREVIA